MKIKKSLLVLLCFVLFLMMIGCGSSEEANDNEQENQKVEYTVHFDGCSKDDMKVTEGEVINSLEDPTKNNKIFTGWFLDKDYKNKLTFPYTVNSNVTFYAKFDDNEDAFQVARKNTIGENATSYEFDYTIDATASYGTTGLSGKTVGNSQFNKNNDISFYDAHTNSGILFIDGTKYQIKNKNTLQQINLDEDGDVTKVVVTTVDDTYQYDGSSFAKALFEYDDDKIKSVEKTSNENEYLLKTSFNFSSALSVLGNNLDNKYVVKLLGTLPESSVDTKMLVTLKNGYIDTYTYSMNISVTAISFNLVYKLTFKNVNKVDSINPVKFDGIAITNEDISKVTTSVASYLQNYKNSKEASYDFEVKTAVGFDGKNDINATFKGSAIRKEVSNINYFYNDIEIDSDYKNSDVYKDANISDVHVKKTKLTNNEVWLIEKKLIGSSQTQVENYTENDSDLYFLYFIMENLNSYTFTQTKTNEDGSITYNIGLNNESVTKLMTYLNKECDLDPLGLATMETPIFGTFCQYDRRYLRSNH